MAFDGIITTAIAYELNKLSGSKIYKIYQPNPNNIILGLYGQYGKCAINICIDSHYYRIHLTTKSKPNPQVAPNFCMLLRKYLINGKIQSVTTSGLERIVTIDLETFDEYTSTGRKKLIIELMGKHSNIILVDKNDIIIDSLRHTNIESNSYRNIFSHQKYILPPKTKHDITQLNSFNEFKNIIEAEPSNTPLEDSIPEKINGIGKSFIKHLLASPSNENNILEYLYNEIKSIISAIPNITLEISQDGKDYFPKATAPIHNDQSFFLSNFIDDFYYNKENNENFIAYRNSLLKLILEQLKKYNKRLSNINTKIKECDNMETYKLYGELITANLYKINEQHLSEITLENYYDNNNNITIPLDKKYTTNINAKRYFKKYNKLKNAIQVINTQKEETINELNYIESIVYELENSTNLIDIQEIYEEISENNIFKEKKNLVTEKKKNKKQNKKSKFNFNPIKYEIDEFTVYVGRNNKENDWLTLKFATNSDIWFHTKDIHGSHVILKTNGANSIDTSILLECAKLAAQHSKGKNSSNVPVDYCKVQYVKKPKSAKPGMVIYKNNNTLYVTP